jgi:penicillin-binding protein 2
MPEARSGLLPSKEWKLEERGESWYPGDTVNIGIGQGDILVTPLQLATAVSVLANRGKAVAPRMLKAGSNLLDSSRVARINDIDLIPDHAWDLIISSMEKVVHRGNKVYGENGTAWAYIGQDISYQMAGKSGTAQVVGIAQGEEYDEEELDERQRKHAWFVAFAPVDDPVIALAVLVENGGGGSAIAAPVARKVLDHYLLQGDRIRVADVRR